MATIGQALTAPEAGWKRYDDTHPAIKRIGSWSVGTSSSMYGGSHLFSNVAGSKLVIRFKGTQMRIISSRNSNFASSVPLTIDGVSYEFNCQSPTLDYQILVFEQGGLSNTEHVVEITVSPASGNVSVDAIDIDENGLLIHPDEVFNINDLEIGKRIRANYVARISGNLGTLFVQSKEMGTFIPPISSATPNGDFYFIMVDTDNRGRKVLIADRNIQHSITWNTLNNAGITAGSGLPFRFSDMDVCIDPLKAISSSNYSGRDAWKAFDNANTSYTGDGWESATTVMPQWIGYDFGIGNEKIITQYTISASSMGSNAPKSWIFQGSNNLTDWVDIHALSNQPDFANFEKRIFKFSNSIPYRAYRLYVTQVGGTGYVIIGELEMMENNPFDIDNVFTLRLLTGGVSSSDKDNEWDKYIVNGTLNETITAGDNTVWNWSGLNSWTSTTNNNNSDGRAIRGTANSYANIGSASVSVGFRPVLIIEELSKTRAFIYHKGEYKNYKDKQWNSISTTLPDEIIFQSEGNNLPDFDRKLIAFNQSMDNGVSLGEGKMFNAKVDLKKFIYIKKIEIE